MDVLINIDVDDLEGAVYFYRTAFGLEIGRRLGDFGVEMIGGSSPIYLLRKESGTLSSPGCARRRGYERHWTPVHLDFVVEDVERAVESAVFAGARLESQIKTNHWGRLALLSDPFGHGFCFVEFLRGGYDQISTTQVDGCGFVDRSAAAEDGQA